MSRQSSTMDVFQQLVSEKDRKAQHGRRPGSAKANESWFRKARNITESFKNSIRNQFFMSHGMSVNSVTHVRAHLFQVDQCLVVKKIGEGACAEVFEAKLDGNSVAIKKVHSALHEENASAQQIHDLLQELRIQVDGLSHPNIVAFKGVCVEGGDAILLAFEFMQGGTVTDVLEKKWGPLNRITMKQKTGWMRNLASALEFLHEKKPPIVHRDLKPDNLMLSKDLKTVKLCDFGLGRWVSTGKPEIADGPTVPKDKPDKILRLKPRRGSLTKLAGTPRWMAPEIAEQRGIYDEKVDIYSAALIIWYMVEEKKPWDDMEGEMAMIMAQQMNRPEFTTKQWKAPLVKAVTAAWSHWPSSRPAAQQLLKMLS